MKTIKSALLLCIPALVFFSCQKADLTSLNSQKGVGNSAMFSNDNRVIPVESSSNSRGINPHDLLSLTTLTYCSPMIVPLCAGQRINVGTVTVKTGSDNNVYVTYQTKGNWFLKQLHLYAGDDAGIPTTSNGNPVPGQFPYTMTFLPPYLINEYTFVIPNMPSTFTIAAHATVVKIAIGSGNIVQQLETGWGDGCSGTPINGSTSGNWGTKFTYNKGNCEPPEICSKAVHYFFDSTLNGVDIPWVDVNGLGTSNGEVTVAGYDYTEAEGRAIYNANTNSDARNGFVQVATLKLSSTNYPQEVELLAAVTTIETWLLTRNKLTPDNLSSNNPAVRDAANFIDFWISRHTCADRR